MTGPMSGQPAASVSPAAGVSPGSVWALLGPGMIAGTWLLIVVAQLSGTAATFHHHALIEGDRPLWLAAAGFSVAWLVMVGAMMVPAGWPAIEALGSTRGVGRRSLALVAFLFVYALAWGVFGVAAFLGDAALHQVVHATPWLEDRPWVIEATLLLLAGSYQFSPMKRRSLDACARLHAGAAGVGRATPTMLGFGVRYSLWCVGGSWALMLLMFGAGFASLAWMAALTLVMVGESTDRHRDRIVTTTGAVLIATAIWIIVGV